MSMTDDEDRLLRAFHESSHAICAALFDVDVRLVSITPGVHFGGVTISSPSSPSSTVELLGRRRGEGLLARWGATPVPMFGSAFAKGCQSIMASLAGSVGEMLAPVEPAGRFVDAVDAIDEQAALATARELTEAQAALLVEADREPRRSDYENAHAAARSIGGPAAAGALVTWCGWEVRRLVFSGLFIGLAEQLVEELLRHEVVGGEFVHDLVKHEEHRLPSLAGLTTS